MFQKLTYGLLFLFIITTITCHKKNPTSPPAEEIPTTMPQTDIPWPSLANSPWPLSHRTPQCVARTHLIGPRTGQTQWETPVPRGKVLCPPVIGADGTIYLSVNVAKGLDFPGGGVYAITPDGKIKWKFEPPNYEKNEQFDGSPIIAADGTIYVASWGSPGFGFLYALNPDGSVKWIFNLEEQSVEGGNNIGLDGTIFTVTMDGYLHAIHPDGTRNWKSFGIAGFESEPNSSISISPDGQTLYLGGLDQTLNAIQAADGKVKWQIKTGIDFNRVPMVDTQGNIYNQAQDKAGVFIFSANADGIERWRYRLSIINSGTVADFVMDWDGYLYGFYSDTLLSLDYAGHLRWKKQFNGAPDRCPLLCDGNNVIYGLSNYGIIKGFGQDGTLQFDMTLTEYGGSTIGAIGENNVLYFISEVPAFPRLYKSLFAVK